MTDLEKYTNYSDDLDTFDDTYNGLYEYGYQTEDNWSN